MIIEKQRLYSATVASFQKDDCFNLPSNSRKCQPILWEFLVPYTEQNFKYVEHSPEYCSSLPVYDTNHKL